MAAWFYILVVLFMPLASLRAELTVQKVSPKPKVGPATAVISPKGTPRRRRPTTLLDWAVYYRDRIPGFGDKSGEEGEETEEQNKKKSSNQFGNSKGPAKSDSSQIVGKANGTGSNTFFDENAAKNGAKVDPGVKESGERNSPKTPPKLPPDGIDPASRSWPFYPMCLYVDVGVSEDVNQTIKKLVDDAAKCRVNLVIRAVTVLPVGDDHQKINAGAQAKCNANEFFGVPASSVSTCSNSKTAPAEMCGDYIQIGYSMVPNPAVKGCAQIQRVTGPIDDPNKDLASKYPPGMKPPGWPDSSRSAPSIEQAGSCNDFVVGHEAQGHSQWGHPNGKGDGRGIGLQDPDDGNRGEGKDISAGQGNGWDPNGCKEMHLNSHPNDGRFSHQPDRQIYYVHDFETQISLYDGVKTFSPKSDLVSGNPQPPPPIRDRGPGFIGDGKPRVTGVRNEQPPAFTGNPPQEIKHPKVKNNFITSAADKLLNFVQQQANSILSNSPISTPPSIPEPKLEDPTQLPEPVVPPPDLSFITKGGSSTSITFDEGAAKNSGAGSALSSGTASSTLTPSIGGESSSVSFNEGAAKGGEKVSVPGRQGSVASSLPPAMITEEKSERTIASEKERNRKKAQLRNKKREFGDGLRKGAIIDTKPLYQSTSPDID